MICQQWARKFRRLYGQEFPTDYCCLDIETTGAKDSRDVILEFGHCLVRNCRPADQLNLVLDWTNHPIVPDRWLRDRLKYMERQWSMVGRKWKLTYQTLQTEGVKPEKVLEFYWDFIQTLKSKRTFFALHNGYAFDERMMRGNFHGFLGRDGFRFGPNNMLDTGAIEKAVQLLEDPGLFKRAEVQADETMEAYFRRICGIRASIKWSLSGHCVEKYELEHKHGLDMSHAHSAGFDAYLVHLLMEEHRQTLANIPADPVESPEALATTVQHVLRDQQETEAKEPPRQPRRGRRRGQRNN